MSDWKEWVAGLVLLAGVAMATPQFMIAMAQDTGKSPCAVPTCVTDRGVAYEARFLVTGKYICYPEDAPKVKW